MDRDSNFSNILSKALDTLGYSFQAIQRRVVNFNELNKSINDSLLSDNHTCVTYILAGSKREGISLSLESDFDQMVVMDDIKCTNNSATNNLTSDFKLIQDDVPQGYTKIQLNNSSAQFDDFSDYIVFDPMSKRNCLSSKLFLGRFNTSTMKQRTCLYTAERKCNAGPSTPISIAIDMIKDLVFDIDNVFALPCIHSDDIIAFCLRERCNKFPSHDLLCEISKMEGHVVPVGQKGSDEPGLLWRICYTIPEIELIQSFNATQYQLYVVLKMLAKSVLKPICPDITSYVVKNIVLWIIELTPMNLFQKDYLSKLIVRSVLFLKMLIRGGFIPNYMIPARNLLAGKMPSSAKLELVAFLSHLLDERESMVLNCPEIRNEMFVLFNCPNNYVLRLEERNSYTDFINETMVAVCKQNAFKKVKSVKAFTEEFVNCVPIARLPKIAPTIVDLPGCVENIAYLLRKPLIVDASQQMMFSAENIASISAWFLSNTSNGTCCMSTLFEKFIVLLDRQLEKSKVIMPSDDSLRMIQRLTVSSAVISENPDMCRDMVRLCAETNLFEAIGMDNMKTVCCAVLRSLDDAEIQRISKNPAYHEYCMKMLKGQSM